MNSNLKNIIGSYSEDLFLTQRLAYDGSSQTEYIGYALPGTAEGEAKWCIKKLTYSSGLVTQVNFAGGNNRFDKVWTDRASLSYS